MAKKRKHIYMEGKEHDDMDIFDLSKHFGCKPATMKDWLAKGIIPGVKRKGNGYIVGDLAMAPYTAGRAKSSNATAVRHAILKAALKHKSTCAKLFKIPPAIYKSYVKDLEERKLIRVLTDKAFPRDVFILTTVETDKYFRDKGFFGKDGKLLEIASRVLEAAVEGCIKASQPF